MTDHKQDPRHQARVKLMQDLFARDFSDLNEQVDELVLKILKNKKALDEQIQSVAPERPVADINKVDLAILRLVLFEAKNQQTPVKVLINEAVELAKEFGSESSPKFVNGVLGKLLISDNAK